MLNKVRCFCQDRVWIMLYDPFYDSDRKFMIRFTREGRYYSLFSYSCENKIMKKVEKIFDDLFYIYPEF